jgi:Flp pilus assembly protein TadG
MILIKEKRFMRLHPDESGSSLIEFAFSLLVLLPAIFGIVYCSLALYVDHYVTNTAREAARYAMVRGSTWSVACNVSTDYGCTATDANVTSYVQSITPLGINKSSPPLTVTTSWPGTVTSVSTCAKNAKDPGCVVSVTVSYSFNFILPFLPTKALTLKSTAAAVIAQ